MKKNEEISLIIPVYNAEKYLKECIESLIKQTYQNLKIIFVNDGSKDNSLNIINEYKEKDSRIIVIDKQNEGVSATRNRGLEEATSDWIIFVDSDDTLELNAVETLVENIKDDSEIILSEVNYLLEDNKKNRIPCGFKGKMVFENEQKKELIQSIFYDNFMGKMYYIPAPFAKMYNREFLNKNNIKFPEHVKYGEDGLFNILCINNASKITFINSVTYNYRYNPESATKKFDSKLIEHYNILLEETKNLLIKENIYNEYENAYLYFVLRQINKYLNRYFFQNENTKTYKEQKIEFKNLIKTEPYKIAVFEKVPKYLPKKRRIMLILIKLRQFWLLKFCYSIK